MKISFLFSFSHFYKYSGQSLSADPEIILPLLQDILVPDIIHIIKILVLAHHSPDKCIISGA